MMRLWQISAIVLILAGCASERVNLPNFDIAERPQSSVSDPVDYPVLCEMPDWDVACWNAFVAFEDAAEANKDIAQLNADSLRDAQGAYDALLQAGYNYQAITEIREEQLQRERDDHMKDVWWYRGLIALGIGLVVTQ